MSNGKVYLIGAGPGHPGLLTCRAKQLLHDCDVVCYDKLVSAAILAIVPKHVHLHEVGYRGYQGTHIEYGMHPDVMEYALAGKKIARLKAGDPCIFGRTTEECRDLNQHGIDFELVPGITAALGAAAYSGFPLTSGGIASSVTFVSGHQHSKAIASSGELGRSGGTLVLYMGAKNLQQHALNLIKSGRTPDTPVAFICSATSALQQCIVGTLETIYSKVEMHENQGPALVVVGEVVTQSHEFNWTEKLPFFGKRVLICGQYESSQALIDLGFEVITIDDMSAKCFITKEDLVMLSQQRALAFQNLATFKQWWHALCDHKFDIRRFDMPLTSTDPFVIKAMQDQGLQPLTDIIEDALVLTLDPRASHENPQYFLIGLRHSKPLGFQLPPVDWVLVEDTTIAECLLTHHSDSVTSAQWIRLNDDSSQICINNKFIREASESVQWVEISKAVALGELSHS